MRLSCAGGSLLVGLACASCSSPASPTPGGTVDGVYALRIESTCTALPEAIRTRDYLALVEGATVSLSGATFWMHPTRGLMNRFSLGTTGTRVGLRFDSLTLSNLPTLVEETGPGAYFGIVGTGAGDVQTGGPGEVSISGTLSVGIGWGENLADDRLHTGCAAGGHQTTFRFTRTSATFVPPRVARTIIRLQISGPASIAPQETVQFAAIGHYPDGSSQDVTFEAQWNRSFDSVFDVDARGTLTGRRTGESNVSASIPAPNLLSPIRDTRAVIVIPTGTFRVSGQVTTVSPAQPVVNAVVTVVSGQTAGLATTTDWEGRYALYGVVGDSQLRVSKDGFEPHTITVQGSSHQTLNVQLQQQSPFPNVGATYTLTLTADPACENPIAPPHNVRTYAATIGQSGRQLTVTLGGASFFVREGRGNGFPGLLDPFQASFQLDDNDHFGIGGNPDVVEQLGGASVLMLLGTITADVGPNRLTGHFSGAFQPATRALPSTGFFWGAACESSRHQVVFSR